MSKPGAAARGAGWRNLALEALRRAAALVCLAAAYRYAVSGFDPRWLVILVLATLVIATGPQYWTLTEQMPPALRWPSLRGAGFGLVPGWVFLTVAAGAKASGTSPRYVIWIWVAGAAWLLIGSWRLGRVQRPASDDSIRSQAVATSPRVAGRWTLAGAALVLAAAMAPRLWEIGTVPRYVHCDEGTITFAAQAFYADPDRDWFAPPPNAGSYSIMNIYFALDGIGVLIGGLNLTSARASDVFLGILSILLLFDGLRRVAGLPVAIAGALLLAGNHSHIAFSRIASGYIQTAFVVALEFALASRMWTRPSYLNAAALGVVAALGLQTYPASLVSLPLLLAVFALQLLLHRERWRVMFVSMALFLISCATAGATFGVALRHHGHALTARSREINILAPDRMAFLKTEIYHTDSTMKVLGLQAWNSLLGFHRGRDTQPQYGIARPLTDSYTAALMIPGLLLALLRLPRFVATNALLWTAGYLLFGLALQFAPGHNRAMGALPLGMVLPAIALVQCSTTAWQGRRSVARALIGLTIAAAVAFCVAENLRIYFVDYLWSRTVGDEQSEAGWVVRRYADRYTVHLVSWSLRYAGYEGQRLIIGKTPVERPPGADAMAYVDSVQLSGSDLFVVSGESPQLRDHLMARYPEARLELWQRRPYAGPVLSLIFVGPPRPTMKTNIQEEARAP
jgi:hypothetical protein